MTDGERLARIEQLVKDIAENVRDVKDAVQSQNGRIRTLEIWRGRLVGAVVVIAFGFPFAWELMRRLIWRG